MNFDSPWALNTRQGGSNEKKFLLVMVLQGGKCTSKHDIKCVGKNLKRELMFVCGFYFIVGSQLSIFTIATSLYLIDLSGS